MCGRISYNKAPGLGCTPNGSLKLAVKTRSSLLSGRLKKEYSLFSGKSKGWGGFLDPIIRSICWRESSTTACYPLSRAAVWEPQYSLLDAISVVVSPAKGALRSGDGGAVLTLDIKNAFISASWN